jgi:hypothetical protein
VPDICHITEADTTDGKKEQEAPEKRRMKS